GRQPENARFLLAPVSLYPGHDFGQHFREAIRSRVAGMSVDDSGFFSTAPGRENRARRLAPNEQSPPFGAGVKDNHAPPPFAATNFSPFANTGTSLAKIVE